MHDIAVNGKTQEEHDARLSRFRSVAEEHGGAQSQ